MGVFMQYTFEKYLTEYATDKENTKREVCQKLLDIYHMNKERVKKLLPAIITMYPHYSEHNEGHSEAIISSIERILGEEGIKALSVADVWMILTCAYMHDIGMVTTDEEVRTAWKTKEFKKFLEDCKESLDKDIKVAAEKALKEKMWQDEEKADWPLDTKRDVILLSSEYFRRKHAGRIKDHLGLTTGEAINKLFDMSYYGMIPPRIERSIATICSMHGADFTDILTKLSYEDTLFNISYHPIFIAVLLRIGDLCDMDNGRFNLNIGATLGQLGKTNLVHYFKHQSISTFHISEKEIFVESNIEFDQIKNEINRRFDYIEEAERKEIPHHVILEQQRWMNYLEEELKELKLNWHMIAPEHLKVTIPDLKYKILVDGKKSICSTENLYFNFSREKAYELIQGYSLYNDKFVFVRELIQNSLDAISIQFWRDIKEGKYDYALEDFLKANKEKEGEDVYSKLRPFDFKDCKVFKNYKVEIEIEEPEDKDYAIFIIHDNGIGISEDDLLNNIIRTGYSWDSREAYEKELSEMPRWLAPTGSFGIGLHSVFAVSDKIYIETKTATESAKEIMLSTGTKEGFVFMHEGGNQKKRGTSIRIEIPKAIIEEVEICNERQMYMLFDDASDLEKIIEEKIKELFIMPLFPVGIQEKLEGRPILCKREGYETLFDKQYRNKVLDKPKEEKYDFAFSDNGRSITIWNHETQIFYVLTFNQLYGSNTNVYCKGISVGGIDLKISYPGIVISEVNIVGENSKKILNVARNELMREGKEKLIVTIKDAYYFAINMYQELLFEAYNLETNTFVMQELEKVLLEITLIDEEEVKTGTVNEVNNQVLIDTFNEKLRTIVSQEKQLDKVYAANLILRKHLMWETKKIRELWKAFIEQVKGEDRQAKGVKQISILIERYIKGVRGILESDKLEVMTKYCFLIKQLSRYVGCLIEWYFTEYKKIETETEADIQEIEISIIRNVGSDLGKALGIELIRQIREERQDESINELMNRLEGVLEQKGKEIVIAIKKGFKKQIERQFKQEIMDQMYIVFTRKIEEVLVGSIIKGIKEGAISRLERTLISEKIKIIARGIASGCVNEFGSMPKSEFTEDLIEKDEVLNKRCVNVDKYRLFEYLPSIDVLYLAYITNNRNERLWKKEVFNGLLDRYLSYNHTYGIAGCTNIGDILMREEIQLTLKTIKDIQYMRELTPLLQYIKLSRIESEDDQFKLSFGMQNNTKWVKADKKSRQDYFRKEVDRQLYSIIILMPFEEYKDIVIDKLPKGTEVRRDIKVESYIALVLAIDIVIAPNKILKEELTQMIEKTYKQKETQNLIRYIWKHNINPELKTKEGLIKIQEVYKNLLEEYMEAIMMEQ